VLSTRPEFGSETDIRKSKNPSNTNSIPSSASLGRNNIQHSISSSALRTSDYSHQVSYVPQSSVPITNHPRSQSVHPSSSHIPGPIPNNIYTSTTSLNSTASGGTITGRGMNTNNFPLTQKSITEYPNRTYRVVFSDDSQMIIRDDPPDGQVFIDPQGKYHEFHRRRLNPSEAIQERLALFYQNEHDLVDYTTSQ
jgi:hypothetical protein